MKHAAQSRPIQAPQKVNLITYVAKSSTPEARRLIVRFGQMPAKNMQELEVRMAYIIREFKEEALAEIAKIHPDRDLILKYAGKSGMTGERGNGEYLYHSACGCGAAGCDGKCKCKNGEHLNFVTNMRSDVYDPMNSGADGKGGRLASPTAKKIMGAGVLILAVLALGVLVVSTGERQRAY